MTAGSGFTTMLAAAAVGLVSGASTVARAQDALGIANNDSICIDGTTFKIASRLAEAYGR